MERRDSQTRIAFADLEAENRMLREEIRVSREAAEITTKLVVEQFEKSEAIMTRLELARNRLDEQNAALEGANLRLQQLDKLKSDFLSSVSHELRTPLTSIRGFASLVEREFSRSFSPLAGEDAKLLKKSGRIQENLGIILKESERLTRLINDVLDLAKIESGRTEWRDATLPVERFVRDAANTAQGMFDTKPAVALRLDIAGDLPPFTGDADRMQQVLVNLLNNAAKFTDQGSVTVSAFLNPEKRIQIEVRDTGAGFPPEEAESIFDKFQQARQGDTLVDRPKGTGLGLAIAREIVERHGGRIWATSEPGKGSMFALTLPPTVENAEKAEKGARLDFSDPQKSSLAPFSAAGKKSVLVVDDDPGVRSYLSQLLQEQGYEVVTADEGQAAISVARECRPSLITMDLAMPVMDGRTAIIQLRADPELQHIPILVVSAIPGWESAGGDLAMCKPVDEPRFIENIRLLLGGAPTSRTRRFLVLHEPGDVPTLSPGSFSVQCEVEPCPLNELPARIQAGFQGMVVVPADMLGRIDMPMLQRAPSCEIMIMPTQGA